MAVVARVVHVYVCICTPLMDSHKVYLRVVQPYKVRPANLMVVGSNPAKSFLYTWNI